MPSGVFKITDIPKEKVARVEGLYRVQGPEKIEKLEQADGRWTVVATFPGSGETEEEFSE